MNMTILGIIIDIVLCLGVFLFVVTDFKRGFLAAVGDTISVFLASIFSSLLSVPLASFIYDNMISPNVINEVRHIVSGSVMSDEQAVEVFGQFPQFIQNALTSMGVTEQTLAYTVNETGSSIPEAVEALVHPCFINFISVLLSVILFFVLMCVLFFVVKLLTKSVNFMGLSIVNKIAGAAVGLIKAAFLVMIIVLVMYLCMSLLPTEASAALQEQIQATTVFKLFFDFNIPSAIMSALTNVTGVAFI